MDAIIPRTMLGLCRHKIGDHAQAKANLESARELSQSLLPEHWLTDIVSSLLGEVYWSLGERQVAEDALLEGYEGLLVREEEVPSRWKPMGLRAATRRLVNFYDSADSESLRSRAEIYRKELSSLYEANSRQKFQQGKIGTKRDGDTN